MRANSILYFSILLIAGNATDIKAQTIDSLAFIEGITILFESAEDRLTTDDEVQIDNLISKHLNTTLYRIEGHTDDVGSIEYNTELAARRANSVNRYLTEIKHIKSANIFTNSYGEMKPAESNLHEESRKYNRRVNLSIYTQKAMRKISGIVKLDSIGTTTIAKILLSGKDFSDSTFTLPNGSWSILAPDSVFVKLDISAPNYFFYSKRIKVTEALDKRQINIELPKLTIGKVYDMPNFYFRGNSPKLLPSSEPTLQLLFGTMASSDVCINIKGHVNYPNAPPVPISHNYYKLSEARAKTVYDYLVKNEINSQRMKHTGYGNWEMVYPNAKKEATMKKNRRVEIEIVSCFKN